MHTDEALATLRRRQAKSMKDNRRRAKAVQDRIDEELATAREVGLPSLRSSAPLNVQIDKQLTWAGLYAAGRWPITGKISGCQCRSKVADRGSVSIRPGNRPLDRP